VKRSTLGTEQVVWTAGASTSSGEWSALRFITTDQLQFINNTSNSTDINLLTTQVFRDASAWYHVLLRADISNATANDRIDIYINGTKVDAYSTQTQPATTVNTGINGAQIHNIGREAARADYYCNLYLADIHFIDGQALDPSSFTTTNLTTGQLLPKAYSGSYGTNGFKLNFSSNASTAALGTDTSGNNNTWTTNNFSVTAGAGNDSLVDTPTSIPASDTGIGGQIVGNYCTWNPLDRTVSAPIPLANGNLDVSGTGSAGEWSPVNGTIGMASGKWYWEITGAGTVYTFIGIAAVLPQDGTGERWPGRTATSYGYYNSSGNKYNNNSSSAYGASYGSGDVIGVAFDADNRTLTFYKNGASQGTAFTSIPAGTYFPCVSTFYTSATQSTNFGQRAFAYTAPSGFKALVDTNLPAVDAAVAKGSSAMDVKLYTGNGSTQTVSGLNFSPDWIWFKQRNTTRENHLYDSVRGVQKALYTDLTNAEATDTDALSSFNSDGWTMGADGGSNQNGGTYVAWCWDAGTTTVSNNSGTISSQVRANPAAGFSIVTYSGNSTSGATIGHGLGVSLSLIIIKGRNRVDDWPVYHSASGSGKYLLLDATSAVATSTNIYNATPTSTVFQLGADAAVNGAYNYVAYCFAPVAGYSAFGSFTGNGSNDGPFVFCNFRPRWVMIKSSSIGGPGYDWCVRDSSRNLYNVTDDVLSPNTSGTGFTAGVDFLSNGFRLRNSGPTENASSQTYVWAAFAESPFAYSRAR
jgi:hypothetical protein